MSAKKKKPFVIDPHSPDVTSETPVGYTESKIKRGQKWAPIFFGWLKKAKVKNYRYFLLDKTTQKEVYYDILTHNIYHVYN